MVVRWTFTDNATAETYTFPINPNEGGTPPLEKTMTYTNTAAPNGRALAFEGRQKVREGSFSGTLLEETHYTAFETWYEKRNQITMTDDLGRSFEIYITKFDAKRVRAATVPWKHTYVVNYVIIDWD